MIRKNTALKPSKLRRHRRKIFAARAGLIFLLFVGLVFLFSWISKMSAIQIEEIEVAGNLTISNAEIIDAIKKETSVKYFMLFSKNSIFLYPKKAIEKKLADEFKKIDGITIKSKGFKTIAVSVVERKPDSLWCYGEAESLIVREGEDSDKCYFLDKGGVVFSKAPDFSGNAFIRYYGLLDNFEQPIGKTYLPNGRFREVSRFISLLDVLGVKTARFQAESESDYEITLKNGVKIIFDDKQSLDKTLENIQSIMSEVNLKGEHPAANSSKINYVDLRFGNKVFLKSE